MIVKPITIFDDQPISTKFAKNLLKKINIIENKPINIPAVDKIRNLTSISS